MKSDDICNRIEVVLNDGALCCNLISEQPMKAPIYFLHFFSMYGHLGALCSKWEIPHALCYATLALN